MVAHTLLLSFMLTYTGIRLISWLRVLFVFWTRLCDEKDVWYENIVMFFGRVVKAMSFNIIMLLTWIIVCVT